MRQSSREYFVQEWAQESPGVDGVVQRKTSEEEDSRKDFAVPAPLPDAYRRLSERPAAVPVRRRTASIRREVPQCASL